MKATDVRNVNDWLTYQSEQLDKAHENIMNLNHQIYKLLNKIVQLEEKLNATTRTHTYDN